MPSKRSTRLTVKQVAKRLKRQFATRNFAKTHFTIKRPMAIGIIIVSIVGTAMLIAASSSEPTSAASVAPDQPIVAIAPVQETPAAKTQKRSATAAQPASAAAVTTAGSDLAIVEGCLVQDQDQFRLKNTTGDDAPKGRSWKSGFLHKSSKTIAVLDDTHRLNLGRHVGERVAVTGVLGNRELQGTSLKRVAESCS